MERNLKRYFSGVFTSEVVTLCINRFWSAASFAYVDSSPKPMAALLADIALYEDGGNVSVERDTDNPAWSDKEEEEEDLRKLGNVQFW